MDIKQLNYKNSLIIILLLILVIFIGFPATLSANLQMSGIEVQNSEHLAKVIINNAGYAQYVDFELKNPYRLVIDIMDKDVYLQQPPLLVVNNGIIKVIRSNFIKPDKNTNSANCLDMVTIEFSEQPQYRILRKKDALIIEVDNPYYLPPGGMLIREKNRYNWDVRVSLSDLRKTKIKKDTKSTTAPELDKLEKSLRDIEKSLRDANLEIRETKQGWLVKAKEFKDKIDSLMLKYRNSYDIGFKSKIEAFVMEYKDYLDEDWMRDVINVVLERNKTAEIKTEEFNDEIIKIVSESKDLNEQGIKTKVNKLLEKYGEYIDKDKKTELFEWVVNQIKAIRKTKTANLRFKEEEKMVLGVITKAVKEISEDSEILKKQLKQSEEVLTLDECIEIAWENNKELQLIAEEIKLARLKVAEASRALYPNAELKWEETRSKLGGGLVDSIGRRFDIDFQHPVYKAGRLRNALRQAEINLKVVQEKEKKIKSDIAYEVEKKFYPLIIAGKNLTNYEYLKQEAMKILLLSKDRFNAKLTTNMEMLTLRSLYNQIAYQILSILDDMAVAKLSLRQVMDIEYDVNIKDDNFVVPKNIKFTLEECLERAFENRPDIKINTMMVKFMKYGIDIADGALKMDIDLSGSLGRGAENFETESLDFTNQDMLKIDTKFPLGKNTFKSTLLTQNKVPQAGQSKSSDFISHTLNISLFDKEIIGATTQIQSAKINYQKALNDLLKVQKSTELDVKEGYYDYEKAAIQIVNNLNKLKMDQEELKITEMKNKLNEIPLSKYLEIKLRIAQNRAAYLQALNDFYIAIARLNWAMGENL